MSQRLVIMRVVCNGTTMGISKRTDGIIFQLQIKIFYTECVNVLSTQLDPIFITPPAVIGLDLGKLEFIENQLSIKLKFSCDVGLCIQAHYGIVITSILLFNGPVKYYWIQIR